MKKLVYLYIFQRLLHLCCYRQTDRLNRELARTYRDVDVELGRLCKACIDRECSWTVRWYYRTESRHKHLTSLWLTVYITRWCNIRHQSPTYKYTAIRVMAACLGRFGISITQDRWLAVWLSGNAMVLINKVILWRVTVSGVQLPVPENPSQYITSHPG